MKSPRDALVNRIRQRIRYARVGDNPIESPPPPPRVAAAPPRPSAFEVHTRKANREKKSRFADRVAVSPPESLLPKVKRLLAVHGTLPTRELLRRANMPAAKLSEVLDHGERIGELRRERRRSESGSGPEGHFVSLTEPTRMERVADEMQLRYAATAAGRESAFLRLNDDHVAHVAHALDSGNDAEFLILADRLEEDGHDLHAQIMRDAVESGRVHRETTRRDESPNAYLLAAGRHPSARLHLTVPPTRFVFDAPANAETVARVHDAEATHIEDSAARGELTPSYAKTARWLASETRQKGTEGKFEPHRYAAYKAPAGGVTVQGVYYPGGQLVPDLQRVAASEPRGTTAPSPTLGAPRVATPRTAKPSKPSQPLNEPPPPPKSLRDRIRDAVKRRAAK